MVAVVLDHDDSDTDATMSYVATETQRKNKKGTPDMQAAKESMARLLRPLPLS